MIIEEAIKHEVKKRVEQLALTKDCPDCRTVGRWRVGEVGIQNNLVAKTRETPGKKDFGHPFDFVVPLTCLQCGSHTYEAVEPQN